MVAPIQRLLIANRGEIAVRIERAARRLGVFTIAVYSEADRDAEHVRGADSAVFIGAASATDSYLNAARLIEAARATGADAIHPGYGFLSENAGFARACASAGLCFVGPPPAAIEAMADKALAKQRVAAAGVPCVPGFDGIDQPEKNLEDEALRLGLPLMIKARAGGGGRGMRLVTRPDELATALASARAEAQTHFGDGRLLLERALLSPRHVEVQVFADQHGHLLHLGERECSIQRRHQKIVEEAPCPSIDAALRARLAEAALKAAGTVDYCGAGTIEFLLDGDHSGRFYFMEMNTRLQVEHAVTEAVTGLDLVMMQLQVASGASLADLVPGLQESVRIRGHAIEVRLCAEDPDSGFLPASGTVLHWRAPSGVRTDHALFSGQVIGSWYDSLLAKIVAHADSRGEAAAKLAAALDHTELLGITHNRAFLGRILRHPAFLDAETSTDFIERHAPQRAASAGDPDQRHWVLAAALCASGALEAYVDPLEQRGWLSAATIARPVRLSHAATEREWHVTLRSKGISTVVAADGAGARHEVTIERTGTAAGDWRATVDGLTLALCAVLSGARLYLQFDGFDGVFTDQSLAPRARAAALSDATAHLSPINGRVVSLPIGVGQRVTRGDVLVVLEAMKMEHPVLALQSGALTHLMVQEGVQVAPGQLLARVSAEP